MAQDAIITFMVVMATIYLARSIARISLLPQKSKLWLYRCLFLYRSERYYLRWIIILNELQIEQLRRVIPSGLYRDIGDVILEMERESGVFLENVDYRIRIVVARRLLKSVRHYPLDPWRMNY